MTLQKTISLLHSVASDYHELDSETREKKAAINNAVIELGWLLRERETQHINHSANRYKKLEKLGAK